MDCTNTTNTIKEAVISSIITEGINGLLEIGVTYADNYNKRKDVGFTTIPSIKGAFTETYNYYRALIIGEEPVVMEPAISFCKKE